MDFNGLVQGKTLETCQKHVFFKTRTIGYGGCSQKIDDIHL